MADNGDTGVDKVWIGVRDGWVYTGTWVELPCELNGKDFTGDVVDDLAYDILTEDKDEYIIGRTDYHGPIADLEGFPFHGGFDTGNVLLAKLNAIELLAASCTRDERLAVAAYITSRDGDADLLHWVNALVQVEAIDEGVFPLIDDRIKFYNEARRVGLSVAEPSQMSDKELERFFSREEYGRWAANLDEVALHPNGFYDRGLGDVDKGLYSVPELVEIGRAAARGRLSREEAYTGVKGALLREAKLAVEELSSQPWVSEEMRADLERLAAGDERAWEPWLVVACADIVSSLDDKGEDALFAWAQHEMNPSRDCSWVAEVANAAAQHDEIPFTRFSEEHGKVHDVAQCSPETRYADWCLDPECGGRELDREGLEHGFDYECYGRDLLIEDGNVSGDFYIPNDLAVDLERNSWAEIGVCLEADRFMQMLELGEEERKEFMAMLFEGSLEELDEFIAARCAEMNRDGETEDEPHPPYPISRQLSAATDACERDDAVRDVATVSLDDHEV